MKTFRTLDIAIEFFNLAKNVEATGYMKDQLHRAASSIPLNLSEGNAKGTPADKLRFFQMAYGSLRECQTIFKMIEMKDEQLLKCADRLGANLYRLENSDIKASPNYR